MKRFLLFVILVSLFLVGLWGWRRNQQPGYTSQTFTPAAKVTGDLRELASLSALSKESTKLAAAVIPSVVSIATAKRIRGEAPLFIDPFLGRIFRGVPQERVQNSLGSGVIVSKEGHILTNHHVIANVDEIKVQLDDGRIESATLVGTDEASDIAVLKISASKITPLPIGDSNDVKVGELVFAIGNPYGLHETVTNGIISATGRREMSDTGREFFQTSAAINPGNSGGPLVNVRGEIIGINTWIASSTGGSEGLGFAIPSNTARRVLDDILKSGHVQRGYLGLVVKPLTPELARQLGSPDTKGAVVTDVEPGSPAATAGVKTGDIITKLNGRALNQANELPARVSEISVGSRVEISLWRNGKEIDVTAEVGQRPADWQTRRAPAPQLPSPTPSSAPNVLSGIDVSEIPADRLSSLPDNVKGVMITQIAPDSPAAQSLQAGDVIEEINRQPILSVDDYTKLAKTLKPNEKQLLIICRGRSRSFVVVTPR